MKDGSQQQRVRRAALFSVALLLLSATPARAQEELNWRSFEEALAAARASGKPVLVDVWAPWCGWCHLMKTETYPALSGALRGRLVLTRLNRDDSDGRVRYLGERFTPLRLAQKLGAEGVPTVVFLAPGGQKLLRTSGFLEAGELRPAVQYVGSGAYRRQSYEAFRRGREGM